jgi:hypothetical protein
VSNENPKNPVPDAGNAVRASGHVSIPSPLKPATARTPIPAKTGSPGASIFDFMRQQNAAQCDANSSAAKGNRGIALGQEQEDRARRAGFIVDGCDNAWRIVKPGDSDPVRPSV